MPLTNLIPYPDMDNGWTGTTSSEKIYEGQVSRKLVGTTGTTEVTINTSAGIALTPSHIYYARMYAFQPTAVGTVGFYWPIAEPSFRDGIPVGPAGAWNFYSHRTNRTSFSAGSYQLRLDFNNGYVAGTTYFGGCMIIDLTADFGSGNEPTQEWCDTHIPFFSGTVPTVTAQEDSITSVSITPNPVYQSQSVNIAVATKTVNAYAVPHWRHSNEDYSGEA